MPVEQLKVGRRLLVPLRSGWWAWVRLPSELLLSEPVVVHCHLSIGAVGTLIVYDLIIKNRSSE